MKQAKLEHLFEEHKTNELSWEGKCHDCKKEIEVVATISEEGINVVGGAIYDPDETIFLKCSECYEKDKVLRNFRVTEVYSRVVGYLRPVSNWNASKQSEFGHRKTYKCMEQMVA